MPDLSAVIQRALGAPVPLDPSIAPVLPPMEPELLAVPPDELTESAGAVVEIPPDEPTQILPQSLEQVTPGQDFNPLRDFSPQGIVDAAIKSPEFDPVTLFSQLPDELKADPAVRAKTAEAFHMLRQRAESNPLADITPGTVAKSVGHMAKGFWDWLYNTGGAASTALLSPLAGKDAEGMYNVARKQAGESLASAQLAGVQLGSMGEKALKWLARHTFQEQIGPVLWTKGLANYTPEDKNEALNHAVASHGLFEKIARGDKLDQSIVQDLKSKGLEFDPELVASEAAGNPLTFEVMGASMAGAGKLIPKDIKNLVGRAGAATGEKLGEVVTKAGLPVGKAAEKIGGITKTVGEKLEPLAKFAESAPAHYVAAHIMGPAGVFVAKLIEKGAKKLPKAGEKLAETGRKLAAGGGEVVGPIGQAVKDVAESTPEALQHILSGAAFDLAFSATTAETPAEREGVGFGAAMGLIGAGKAVGKRAISGQLIGKRHGAFTPDMTQKFLDTVAPGTEFKQFSVKNDQGVHSDELSRKAAEEWLISKGVEAAEAKKMSQAAGVTQQLPDGKTYAISTVERSTHEFVHAIQSTWTPEQLAKTREQVRSRYTDEEWAARKQDIADKLHRNLEGKPLEGITPDEYLEKTTGQAANEYVNDEIQAEHLTAFVQHAGPALKEGTSIPEVVARGAAAVIKAFGGEPLEGRISPSPSVGMPLKHDIVTELASTVREKIKPESVEAATAVAKERERTQKTTGAAAKAKQWVDQQVQTATPVAPAPVPAPAPKVPAEQRALVNDITKASPKAGKRLSDIADKIERGETLSATEQHLWESIQDAPVPPVSVAPPPLPPETITPQKAETIKTVIDATSGEQQPMKVLYRTAPEERGIGQDPTSERFTRRQEVKAGMELPPEQRDLREITIQPIRTENTSEGPHIIATSPDSLEANLAKVNKFFDEVEAKRPGSIKRLPYDPRTPEGRKQLEKDIRIYNENQRLGFTGSGKSIVVPEEVTRIGEGKIYKPQESGTPTRLDQDIADLINYLYNDPIPEGLTSASGKVKMSKVHLLQQKVAEATIPGAGRVQVPVTPRGEFSTKQLTKAGFPASEVGGIREVNPLRQWIEKTAQDLGIQKPSPIDAILRLRASRIEDSSPMTQEPALPTKGSNPLTRRMGFEPDEISRVADMPLEDYLDLTRNFKGQFGGGQSGWSFELASKIKSADELAALRSNYEKFRDLSRAAMAEKDFNSASMLASKSQAMREAYEAATNKTFSGEPASAEEFINAHYGKFESPMKEKISAHSAAQKVAEDYAKTAGIDYTPPTGLARYDRELGKTLAAEYEKATHSPEDPEVVKSYTALRNETLAQWKAIKEAGYDLEPLISTESPYKGGGDVARDLEKKHMFFNLSESAFGTPGQGEHQLMLAPSGESAHGTDLSYNDVFRAVHDFFGHGNKGLSFGPRGEFNAWREHSAIFSKEAQGALAAETIGQTAWTQLNPKLLNAEGKLLRPGDPGFTPRAQRPYAEQKNFVMPEELVSKAKAQFEPADKAGIDKKTERSIARAAKLWREKGTNSPFFKKWFGKSKVVDSEGAPLEVYHGTTHEFDAFDTNPKGNPENFLGKGHYFTSSKADARDNYAGRGPDLTNRIEQRVDEIMQAKEENLNWGTPEHDEAMEAARIQAARELEGGESKIIKAYLKLENPVVLDRKGGTTFEYNYNERTGAEEGTAIDLYDAILSVARDMKFDGQKIWDLVTQNGIEDLTAHHVAEMMKEAVMLQDEYRMASEFPRRVFEEMGFDGVEQTSPAERFPNMGIDEEAKHFIAFKPEQIKSADNRGTFSKDDPRYAFEPEGKKEVEKDFEGAILGTVSDAAKISRKFEAEKKRVGDELPHVVGKPIKLVHLSSNPGLKEVDPAFLGKGKATPGDLRGAPKSFWFVKGSKLESDENVLGLGGHHGYTTEISGDRIYDLSYNRPDPLGYFSRINREEADTVLKKAGYDGLYVDTADGRKVVMLYTKQPVEYQKPFKGKKAFEADTFLADPEFEEMVDKVRTGQEGGATFAFDGKPYEWDSSDPRDVVTLKSINLPQGQATAEAVKTFLREQTDLLDNKNVVAGIFSFSKDGKPTISVDINALVPQKFRKNTLEFAKNNDQVAIWDPTSNEEIRTGGKGNTRLNSLGEISEALSPLLKGEEVNVDEIKRQNQDPGAAKEEQGFFEGVGGKEVLSSTQVANMTKAEIAKHFPEAVTPAARGDRLDYGITKSPLYKEAGSEEAATKAFSTRLVDFAKEYLQTPEFQGGTKWYSEFVPMLKKVYQKHAETMAQLLAATSPRNSPQPNFALANDALQGFKAGRFDKQISKYLEGVEMINGDKWEKWYNKERKAGKLVNPRDNPTPEAFMAEWIFKHKLQPKQSNGKLYGMHSTAVLQVLAGNWLTENTGPKTHQFVKNLLGIHQGATIDVWAARTMRRLGFSGFKDRWRILPGNETGISDQDFHFSQKAFAQAAAELGLTPDALQGGLWFAEKRLWADNGWGRLDLGDYRNEIKKVELLNTGIEQRLAAQKAAAKTNETKQQTMFEPDAVYVHAENPVKSPLFKSSDWIGPLTPAQAEFFKKRAVQAGMARGEYHSRASIKSAPPEGTVVLSPEDWMKFESPSVKQSYADLVTPRTQNED